MTDGRLSSPLALKRALKLVQDKGVCFLVNKGRSLSLRVHTDSYMDAYHLERTLGGGFYPFMAKGGRRYYVWSLMKREDLIAVYRGMVEADLEIPPRLRWLAEFCVMILNNQ